MNRHCALSMKCRSLTSVTLSSSGIDDRTTLLLLTHFVKQNPPLEYRVQQFLDRATAWSSDDTDFKQLSTWTFLKTVPTTSGVVLSFPYSAVLCSAYNAQLGMMWHRIGSQPFGTPLWLHSKCHLATTGNLVDQHLPLEL